MIGLGWAALYNTIIEKYETCKKYETYQEKSTSQQEKNIYRNENK